MTADPEGEEFLEKLDKGYQTQVEAFINLIAVDELASYAEAINSPNHELWKKAMEEEMESLLDKNTFELVERPEDRRIISCKWVWQIKRDSKGNIKRYKARLVARSFTQIHGLNYLDTYAPVTRLETIRLLCAMANKNDWEIRHIDIKTAYLNSNINEEIYMEIPDGFMTDQFKTKVLHLKKAIYGLKQAGCQWYRKLREALKQFGLIQTASDPHTFITHKKVDGVDRTLILSVYVDDLLPISNKVLTDNFERWIPQYFEVTKPTDAEYFLGLHILRNRKAEHPWITLDQHLFIKTIIDRFDIDKVKATVPLSSSFKALPNPDPVEKNDPKHIQAYQSKLGSLMYLMLGTRPDIAYAVGVLGRFSSNPSADHLTAIDRLFNYIEHSKNLILYYKKENGGKAISPEGFVDADLAREATKSRSTQL